jgi:hypothetical protein
MQKKTSGHHPAGIGKRLFIEKRQVITIILVGEFISKKTTMVAVAILFAIVLGGYYINVSVINPP